MTRISTKDFRNLPIEKWNVTTFREYLKHEHEERYKIPYVTRSHAMEGRMLKSFIAEHKPEATKQFIDACFADYKPTREYPGLNFAFMYSYMRFRLLPRVLEEIRRKEVRLSRNPAHKEVSTEEIIDYL
ncbi:MULTISPECIES: hypothetical protein [Bacillus cereus group]|uniref:Uncharacterized protein n=2 Tax=Bacillus cereus group TaxID=86661 RepID=A0A9X7G2E3_BACTU|nr:MULTISPECIES: hypothetical protein [Bacillus cereus group]EKS8371793.1 hypothetical protein [Bacillus cereus]MBG9493476.1 hypothetical protein [Bacillus thuringiensis]MBG9506630.1 hypothetical protein [Bacillus thuringiensis]MBG9510960.1 hypothetical protein [Bacillus thuringiensis]MBG9520265.1 hypothetical protein [Bacillus thuringiensis]